MEAIIREKNIISGGIFEAEFYPIFSNGRRLPATGRRKKKHCSTKEQKNLNDKNARKKIIRLVNTNFRKNDIVIHGTYRDNEMPSCVEKCRRDIQNYIRRVKRYRKNEGLPEMKYIYVIEAKTSKKTGLVRYHFHMITNAMDRNVAETMWGHGEWTNADRLQPNERGFEALAKYLTKNPEGKRRWAQSKNLKKPEIPKPKDGKISKRFLQKLASERMNDVQYWEKRYKGCKFIEAEAMYNDFNGFWYLSITMAKTNDGGLNNENYPAGSELWEFWHGKKTEAEKALKRSKPE